MKLVSKTFVLFLFVWGAVPTVLGASLKKDLRQNIDTIIQGFCHSKIEYHIDDSVGFDFLKYRNTSDIPCESGKCKEYHETMNCLLNDALEKKSSNIHKKISELALPGGIIGKHKEPQLTSKFLNFTVNNCEKKTMADIVSAQRARGFVSRCKEFESPSVAQQNSLCHLTEAALLEYCGYEKFLLIKIKDKQSFEAEFSEFQETSNDVPRFVKEVYARELYNAQQSLTESLHFYRNFQIEYQKNLYWEAFQFHVSVFRDLVTKFSKAVATFPAKFINASINF